MVAVGQVASVVLLAGSLYTLSLFNLGVLRTFVVLCLFRFLCFSPALHTDATPRDLTVGVVLGIKRLIYIIIGYWSADNLYFFQIPQRTAEYSMRVVMYVMFIFLRS